ncbi:MAG TPA: cell division protein ZapA [Cryomorphaceae bacterium]|nr:cell division protein ZapA [Owenweeksia sp.]HAD97735.1 cell division protein ZapA [Cryomorphaceae bacterium]HBF19519.1 cell division protein ZapA [Cryomorphaceae bacterium]HCQ17435.1 cell division protein ZapA [Cryomorphaceae bacterium]
MSDYLKIKVSIADRVYPLTIRREEEEQIRAAAKTIDGILKKYEEGYAVRDKQDLLAMCALQLASRIEKNKDKELVDAHEIGQQLGAVEALLINATK